MSRTPKHGIDYAGWDTAIFEADTKIDALLDAQGGEGFYIYFYLCQKAYASDGYFYRWRYADATTTARKMGGRIRAETVKATVGTCCKVGLFDKRLLECEGILSSRGIQRRFIAAIQKRSYRAVDRRYWLLDEAETAAEGITFLKEILPDVGDSYAHKDDFLPEKADFLPENSPYKVKESNKEEEDTRTREGGLSRVMTFFLDRINSAPSSTAVGELKSYTQTLGADVVLHALEIAADENARHWSYIKGILSRYQRDGLDSLEKVRRSEEEYNERRRRHGSGGNSSGNQPDSKQWNIRYDNA